MNARIYLKDGTNRLINDLTSVKMHSAGNIAGRAFTTDELDRFYMPRNRSYSFIGDNILIVHGENINSVEFFK